MHALAHAINQALGNVGKTVSYTDPVDANPVNQTDSLKDLVADMRGGKVDMLFILGGNPAYDAPADFGFADALKNTNIPLRVHLGLYQDETAELCQWHVNEAHYLESWGDARAYDGTVSIVQPLIAPLYSGKSANEMTAFLAGQAEPNGHELVQEYWKKQAPGADFDAFWRKSLHNGWIEGTAFTAEVGQPKPRSSRRQLPATTKSIEINFRRDPSVYDGRFSNNGWLQELPKPMTKMTWDNPVLIGPAMAERLGLKTEDVRRARTERKEDRRRGLDSGRASRQFRHRISRLRTHARRARGHGRGVRYVSAALQRDAVVHHRREHHARQAALTSWRRRRATRPWTRRKERVRWCATATLEEYRKEPEFAREEEPPQGLDFVPALSATTKSRTPGAWRST